MKHIPVPYGSVPCCVLRSLEISPPVPRALQQMPYEVTVHHFRLTNPSPAAHKRSSPGNTFKHTDGELQWHTFNMQHACQVHKPHYSLHHPTISSRQFGGGSSSFKLLTYQHRSLSSFSSILQHVQKTTLVFFHQS